MIRGIRLETVLALVLLGLARGRCLLAAGTANPPSAAQSDTRITLGLNPIDVSTSDGYFMNEAGKLGPVASFTFFPPLPSLGGTVFFNSTS